VTDKVSSSYNITSKIIQSGLRATQPDINRLDACNSWHHWSTAM